MSHQKIAPMLWFHTTDGATASVIAYYTAVFQDNVRAGHPVPLGTTPSGNAEMCEVHLFDQPYTFMCTEQEHHPFTDAVSFVVQCADQQEIDLYWNYFTADGTESQCGWCIDKYGVRWQIIPQNLPELMSKPHAIDIMMRQRKIVIAEYEALQS